MEERTSENKFRVHLKPNSFLLHKQNLQQKLDRYEEDFTRAIKGISERQKQLSSSLSSENEHSSTSSSINVSETLSQGIGDVKVYTKTRKISKSESYERTKQGSRKHSVVQKEATKMNVLPKAWSFPAPTGNTTNQRPAIITNINENKSSENASQLKRTLRRQKRLERIDITSNWYSHPITNTCSEKISVGNFVSDQKDKHQMSFTEKSQQQIRDVKSTQSVQPSTQVELNERDDTNEQIKQTSNTGSMYKMQEPSLLRPINYLATVSAQHKIDHNKTSIKSVDDISKTVLDRPKNGKLLRSRKSLSPIPGKQKDTSMPFRSRASTLNGNVSPQQVKSAEDSLQKAKNQYLTHFHRNAWSMDANEHDFDKFDNSSIKNNGQNINITKNQEEDFIENKHDKAVFSRGHLKPEKGNIERGLASTENNCAHKYSDLLKDPRRKNCGRQILETSRILVQPDNKKYKGNSFSEENDSDGQMRFEKKFRTQLNESFRGNSVIGSQGDNNIIEKRQNTGDTDRIFISPTTSCEENTVNNKPEGVSLNKHLNPKTNSRENSGKRIFSGNGDDKVINDEFKNVLSIESSDFGDSQRQRTLASSQVQEKCNCGNSATFDIEINCKGVGKMLTSNQRKVEKYISLVDKNREHLVIQKGAKCSRPRSTNHNHRYKDIGSHDPSKASQIENDKNISLQSTNNNQEQKGDKLTNHDEGRKREDNLPKSRGWRKLREMPLTRIQQFKTNEPKIQSETLKDFKEKCSNVGPGLLSFQQVVLAAIKREKEKKAHAERKKQLLFKERMTEIQQPTESFLRQTLGKVVHRSAQGPRPQSGSSKGRQFRTVVRSLQGFRELSKAVGDNKMKREERIRKKSNVTLPYTRKLELLSEEHKTVGEMMKDVEDCRYLRYKKIQKH